jgi:hypothetical protein
MTIRPENLAAISEGGLATNTTVDISLAVDGTTNRDKERPKMRPSSLNPKISTTNTSAVGTTTTTTTTTGGATSAGTSTTTGASTTSGKKGNEGAKASTNPPSSTGEFLPRDASTRTDGGGGKSRPTERWAVEEEKKLVSALETFGSHNWAKIAANVPGRNENQCKSKWWNMSKKATSTGTGTWTHVEEEQLVSAVESFGTASWVKVAGGVPGRNETQCRNKWYTMSRKATSTGTGTGTWTEVEEQQLVSAVETVGSHNWAKIADYVPGRNENQCGVKWWHMSKKATSNVTGTWTEAEKEQLVSAVESFGTDGWAKVARGVPGRNETQCDVKWRNMSKKATSTVTGTWTLEEKTKLISAVETFGGHHWAKIAAKVPGRNENQCKTKWSNMSRKAAATSGGTWTVEEEMKLVYAVEAYDGRNWAGITKMVPGRNESQCRSKWQRMSKENVDAESVPKTDAAVLSQLSGLEVGPDLHVFSRDTQKFRALIEIATAVRRLAPDPALPQVPDPVPTQSLLESISNVECLAASTSNVGWRCETVSLDDARASVREWKNRLGVPPTEPAGIHDDSFSDADLSNCCNTTVEDFGDNIPNDETTIPASTNASFDLSLDDPRRNSLSTFSMISTNDYAPPQSPGQEKQQASFDFSGQITPDQKNEEIQLPDLTELQMQYQNTLKKLGKSMRRSDVTRSVFKRQRKFSPSLSFESDDETDYLANPRWQQLEQSQKGLFCVINRDV